MPTPSSSLGTVIITGAARRIGRAIALDLADAGWQVVIHYRTSKKSAQSLVTELKRRGAKAIALHADLALPAQRAELISDCTRTLSAPTCLINNASEFFDDRATALDEGTWDHHMQVNLKAPVFLAAALAANLPEGATGNVINLIDQRVLHPGPEFFSYTVSKSALWTATRTLAQALAPFVRVNAISPGPVLRSVHQTEAEFANEVSSTLLKRAAALSEITAAVRFILASPSMTGQMITLDSGQHLASS